MQTTAFIPLIPDQHNGIGPIPSPNPLLNVLVIFAALVLLFRLVNGREIPTS